MIDNITYRRAVHEDLEACYIFHKNYLGEIRSRYVWEWEFGKENLFNQVLVLALNDDKIVATQGMMCIPLVVNGVPLVTAKNESLLIENEYRKRGLSTELYHFAFKEYQKEDAAFLWGFSKKARVFTKVGFTVISGAMKNEILSLSFSDAIAAVNLSKTSKVKSTIIKAGILAGSIYSKVIFFSRKIRIQSRKYPFAYETAPRNPGDIIAFFDKVRLDHPNLIHLFYNADYFTWRINKSPVPIQSFFAYDQDHLVGWMFLTVRDTSVELSEIIFENYDAGNFLMQHLMLFMQKSGTKVILYTGNIKNKLNTTMMKFLQKFGFIQVKGSNDMVIKNFTFSDEDYLFDISHWYINGLWSEGN